MSTLQDDPAPARSSRPPSRSGFLRSWRIPQHRDGMDGRHRLLAPSWASPGSGWPGLGAQSIAAGVLLVQARRGRPRDGGRARGNAGWGRINYPPC
ncbi:hypothetical protein K1T35_16775 [Pseudonocardia sp. DSM 110487]|uniref:hypothetical protein n=1 Tax=Pseudonocardia sp. DSM 110487 TaxID=2865833 RepID=UPI001C69E577|nr:hypothetical protein [Pseudonocardia sp. DSM 110487]QYN38709.1 hypothetical protein K1T35_16775 [Pseudonocardia sp. DSM 110487]